MTYRLVDSYTFKRTVEVRRPSPDHKDKIEIDRFTAVFLALEADELEALDDRLAQSATVKESVQILIDFAARVTTGWEDVLDAADKPVAFAEEPFRHHLRTPWFRDGVIAAYRAAMRGEDVRLGN